MITAVPSILLVEDDEGIRESLAELLKLEGYAVDTAVDGLDALDKLKEGILPRWVLMDLSMPRMGGRECLAQMRTHAEWKEIPVTFLSAARQSQTESYANHVDYLEKPTDISIVIAAAKKHCN